MGRSERKMTCEERMMIIRELFRGMGRRNNIFRNLAEAGNKYSNIEVVLNMTIN
jgi:hypothetical protein